MSQELIKKGETTNAEISEGILTYSQQTEIQEAFDLFSSQEYKVITLSQLGDAAQALGLSLSLPELQQVMGGKDVLNFSQFFSIVSQLVARQNPLEELKKIFRLFDQEKRGYVNIQDLKRIAAEIGEKTTTAELQLMISVASETGQVTFDDFVNVMKKSSMY